MLVAAQRVAATVAQGVHGRRRTGQGESFWQFRPFFTGDASARIDWRQSAKSDRTYVRETEWEAAQTVALWRDGSASMQWRSAGRVTKAERADLLLLALAALVLRGGERVLPLGLPGAGERPLEGRAALDRLARVLGPTPDPSRSAGGKSAAPSRSAGGGPLNSPPALREGSGVGDQPGLPVPGRLPRHATAVLLGDFLSPLDAIRATLGTFAAIPVRGHLVQILDPAEASFPYRGRVRFAGLEREQDTLIPRSETIRDAYAQRLAAHQHGLEAIARASGFTFAVHYTDRPPETALLGLYTRLAAR